MRFSTGASLLSIAGLVAAQTTHNISVGANQGLTFDPPQLNAPMGDIVQFVFMGKNHSVTQSTFPKPCELAPNGVDSGFQLTKPNATDFAAWSFQINSTDPLWFFCAQVVNGTAHCAKGMVFALNPTAEKSFDSFKATAMNGASNGTAASGTGSAGSASSTGAAGGSSGAAGATGGSGSSGSSTGTGSPTVGTQNPTDASAANAAATSNAAVTINGNVITLVSVASLVLGLTL